MPKRQRRERQHLRQTPSRRKARPASGELHYAKPKPGFPMNVLTDIRWFSIAGIVAGAAMVFAALLTQGGGGGPAPSDVIDTPTPSDVIDTPTPAQFSEAGQVIDAAANTYTATLQTEKGDIIIELFAEKAPNTVNSFVFLAQEGYFDGITFHRVDAGFVAQTGDPTATGGGGPGYETEQETTDLTNTRGRVSMARASGSTRFGSQFFINLNDNLFLDQDQPNQAAFFPFAEVTSGMEVVDLIAQGDIIISVTIEETSR